MMNSDKFICGLEILCAHISEAVFHWQEKWWGWQVVWGSMVLLLKILVLCVHTFNMCLYGINMLMLRGISTSNILFWYIVPVTLTAQNYHSAVETGTGGDVLPHYTCYHQYRSSLHCFRPPSFSLDSLYLRSGFIMK